MTDPADVEPIRSAATVVLLRDSAAGPEVFLLERVRQMAFAPGMTVFPGGGLDPSDLTADLPWTGPGGQWWADVLQTTPALAAGLVSTAVRELFEESGVLLASPADTTPPTVDLGHPTGPLHDSDQAGRQIRADLDAGRIDWSTFLAAHRLRLDAHLLRPWARWITPVGAPRRYDTHFFVAALPAGQVAASVSTEAVAGRWMTPREALDRATVDELTVMRPTRSVLTELAGLSTVGHVMAATVGPVAASAPPPLRTGRRLQAPVTPRRTSPLTRVVLAPNPGPMTLDGTNTYLLAAPGSDDLVVVDPGPDDTTHLEAVAAAGRIRLVLITHRHADHTAGAARLRALTGAPVRAIDPAHCHGGEPLRDGEQLVTAGITVEVLATPGHTGDSVSFLLRTDGPHGSVLTGDTVLGRGTTVLDHPDGSLSDYLRSLDRLITLGAATVLPAHGPVLPDLAAVATTYRRHRRDRLAQVEQALSELGAGAGAEEVADLVYRDVPTALRGAALRSVRAQLDHLRNGASPV